jgi:hypothetical protein
MILHHVVAHLNIESVHGEHIGKLRENLEQMIAGT